MFFCKYGGVLRAAKFSVLQSENFVTEWTQAFIISKTNNKLKTDVPSSPRKVIVSNLT